jgi:hypothetical protein
MAGVGLVGMGEASMWVDSRGRGGGDEKAISCISAQVDLTVAFKPALAVDLNGCKHKLAPAPQDDFYSRNLKLTSTVVTLSPLWWQNYSFFLVFLSFLVFRSAFRFPALYFGFYLSLKYSSTTLVTF